MACNNGKKGLHSPYGMITDLNITYTGCSTTCNGEEIKPGMRLREILDILIGNCAEGGAATWGDIIGNIEDQTDLVQFIQDNISVANWGDILGDITDQEDLVQFVQDNGFGEDKIGTNLHLDEDGKVNLGVDVSDIAPGALLITLTGEFTPDTPYFLIEGSEMALTADNFNLQASNILVGTSGGRVEVNTLGGDIEIHNGGGEFTLNQVSNFTINNNNGGRISISNLSYLPDSVTAYLGKFSVSDQYQYGIFVTGGGATAETRQVIVGTRDSVNNSWIPVVFQYASAPQLTGDLQLVHKGYIDAQISSLQDTIDALEARIEALENA